MIPKPILIVALALCLPPALRAQDIARNIKIATNLTGTVTIDSTRFERRQPAAKLESRSQYTLGRNGFLIFRYQATGWWDKHEPLVRARPPFAYVPNPKEKARFKDRLYAGVKKKDLHLTLDGESADGPSGIQGAGLWKTTEPQNAYWDFNMEDDADHVLTILTCHGARMTYSVAPLGNPEAWQKLATLDETGGAAAIQFTFKGSIRVILEHTAFTPDDLGKGSVKRYRKPANISAIFLD